MSKWISLAGMFIGAVGIFFGFFYLANNPQRALAIVTVTTVGMVGVLAFVLLPGWGRWPRRSRYWAMRHI